MATPILWETPDKALRLTLPSGWVTSDGSGMRSYPGQEQQKDVISGSMHTYYAGGTITRRQLSFIVYNMSGLEKSSLSRVIKMVADRLRAQGNPVLRAEARTESLGLIHYRFTHTGDQVSQVMICARCQRAFYVIEMTAPAQDEDLLLAQADKIVDSATVGSSNSPPPQSEAAPSAHTSAAAPPWGAVKSDFLNRFPEDVRATISCITGPDSNEVCTMVGLPLGHVGTNLFRFQPQGGLSSLGFNLGDDFVDPALAMEAFESISQFYSRSRGVPSAEHTYRLSSESIPPVAIESSDIEDALKAGRLMIARVWCGEVDRVIALMTPPASGQSGYQVGAQVSSNALEPSPHPCGTLDETALFGR